MQQISLQISNFFRNGKRPGPNPVPAFASMCFMVHIGCADPHLLVRLIAQFAAELAQLLKPDADKALEPSKHTNRLLFTRDCALKNSTF